jgi:hypothetical protein
VIVSLAGGRTLYQNADGSFNLAKWKARIDLFRGYDFAKYVSAGTVIGHYLVDEAACAKCWGGKTLTYSQMEEMSRYSKSIWPTLPTGVRAPPSLLGSMEATAAAGSRAPSAVNTRCRRARCEGWARSLPRLRTAARCWAGSTT